MHCHMRQFPGPCTEKLVPASAVRKQKMHIVACVPSLLNGTVVILQRRQLHPWRPAPCYLTGFLGRKLMKMV